MGFQRRIPQVLAAVLLFAGAPGLAQQPPPPVAAPARKSPDTAFLRQYAETRRFMNGRPAGVRITPDDQSVLFLRTSPTSNVQMLYAFDVANGQTRELLTPEALLKGTEETLSPEEKARRES